MLDHVGSNQHKAAMPHLHTAQVRARNEPVTSYAPIARSLLMLEESERGRMRCKFDLCYLMAKEGIMFEKYAPLYELEVRHDVDLGHTYKTALIYLIIKYAFFPVKWEIIRKKQCVRPCPSIYRNDLTICQTTFQELYLSLHLPSLLIPVYILSWYVLPLAFAIKTRLVGGTPYGLSLQTG